MFQPPAFGAGEAAALIIGGLTTVNSTLLLVTPETVTDKLPVVDPPGTGTTREFVFQLVGFAVVPLKLSVLVPSVEPKFAPAMVIGVPGTAELGERLEILGSFALAKVRKATNCMIHGADADRVEVAS